MAVKTVSIEVVRDKLDSILHHLLEHGLRHVEIGDNMYWVVPDPEKYNLDADPSLEVGDVSFDAELIGKIDQPLALELLYFSEILRLIALEGSRRNL